MEDVFSAGCCFSSILSKANRKAVSTAIARNTQYRIIQLLYLTANQLARIGAMKDAIALTNWPKVRELARLSPETTHPSSGLRDTCMRVFPIPRKQKETSISG